MRWWSYIINLVNEYVPVKRVSRNFKPRLRLSNHIRKLHNRRNHARRMPRTGVTSARAQYICLRSRYKAALHLHFKNRGTHFKLKKF